MIQDRSSGSRSRCLLILHSMKDDPMKRYLLATVAAFGLSATMAAAQSAAEQVAEQLAARGYTGIEVRQTGQAIHAEAVKDGIEYEYLYNAVTGEILGQEARPVDDDDENGADEDGEDGDHGSQGGGFDRGEDGNHGHGNSGGYDEDNPGRSHDERSGEDRSRADRGEDGDRRQGKKSDNPGRGRDNGH